MPRRRRYFESGGLYEITIRACEGLPLPAKESLILLIKSSIARTQRNVKVHICHFLWMGNHAHILVVSRDALMLTQFYGEIQKRITDYLKRLLGKPRLELWEGSCSIIRIADLEAAIERIAYFYANPAKANLVDSIEEYPGYSSFLFFRDTSHTLLNRYTEKIPWIRCPAVPLAPSHNLSIAQDKFLKARLEKSTKLFHTLVTFPNLWMSCFKISSKDEIRSINQRILGKLTALELQARDERRSKGTKTMGRNKLINQPLTLSHTPQKHSRRIFVIASSKEVRLAYIKAINAICDKCSECYQKWKNLDFSCLWPPGTFPPPLPMSANSLA